MKPREVVRVFPVGNSWLVSWRGGGEQCSFGEKEVAVAFATECARRLRPSTLAVIDREGETEYELNY